MISFSKCHLGAHGRVGWRVVILTRRSTKPLNTPMIACHRTRDTLHLSNSCYPASQQPAFARWSLSCLTRTVHSTPSDRHILSGACGGPLMRHHGCYIDANPQPRLGGAVVICCTRHSVIIPTKKLARVLTSNAMRGSPRSTRASPRRHASRTPQRRRAAGAA